MPLMAKITNNATFARIARQIKNKQNKKKTLMSL
jgi:hypothetical protein